MSDILFVLASGSPRRREFMRVLGVPFRAIEPAVLDPGSNTVTEVDETPHPGESPPKLVQRLSRLKAQAVLTMLPGLNLSASATGLSNPVRGEVIIAADTVVVLGNEILGKPQGPAHARQMLQALRRENHQVCTGFTVAIPPETAISLSLTTADQAQTIMRTSLHQSTVWMRPYTDQEIDAYVASGDPLDKAGAYGIQNETFAPVSQLDGCFAGVMGLPLGALAATLRALHVTLPPIAPLCSRFTGRACCQL